METTKVKIEFNIPTNYYDELLEAISKIYNYNEHSGMDKKDFLQQITISFWRELIIRRRAESAKEEAVKKAIKQTEDFNG